MKIYILPTYLAYVNVHGNVNLILGYLSVSKMGDSYRISIGYYACAKTSQGMGAPKTRICWVSIVMGVPGKMDFLFHRISKKTTMNDV